MRLTKALAKNKLTLSVEVTPPKGNDVKPVLEWAEGLRGLVDFFYIASNRNAVMRAGALSMARLLQEKGLNVALELSPRDQNRIALQSDILSASVFGITDLIVREGDKIEFGDHPDAKSVFDLEFLELIKTSKLLRQGRDLAGNPVEGHLEFFVGAEIGFEGLFSGLLKKEIEDRLESGADFLFTLPVFDELIFDKFMQVVSPYKIPVIAGIMLLKSVGMARYIRQHQPHLYLPEGLIDKLSRQSDRVKAGIEVAQDLISGLESYCQGICITPLGWEEHLALLLQNLPR